MALNVTFGYKVGARSLALSPSRQLTHSSWAYTTEATKIPMTARKRMVRVRGLKIETGRVGRKRGRGILNLCPSHRGLYALCSVRDWDGADVQRHPWWSVCREPQRASTARSACEVHMCQHCPPCVPCFGTSLKLHSTPCTCTANGAGEPPSLRAIAGNGVLCTTLQRTWPLSS